MKKVSRNEATPTRSGDASSETAAALAFSTIDESVGPALVA